MPVTTDDLLHLLPSKAHFQFETRENLVDILKTRRLELNKDLSREQYFVFTSVPHDQFDHLDVKYARFRYNSSTNTLIAKVMKSPIHDLVTGICVRSIEYQTCIMGLTNELLPVGGFTFRLNNWAKEADYCWAPSRQLPNPTLVIETGISESSTQLAIDARGWLETPGSPVRQVITIDINQDRPIITAKLWKLVNLNNDRRVTRGDIGRAREVHTIQISLDQTTPQPTIVVPSSLQVSFDLVVGRPPRQGTPEADFVITQDQLRQIAKQVWVMQKFISST